MPTCLKGRDRAGPGAAAGRIDIRAVVWLEVGRIESGSGFNGKDGRMTHPIRVLLTDDEERFAKSMAKVLRNRNMEVFTAHDGAAALKFLSESECDVVVLDLRMPGMDGIAVLERICQLKPELPVIMLSGNMDVDNCSLALCDGAVEVLLKPCPIDTLTTAIENAYERKLIDKEVADRKPA
jgi:two-component system, OmpR family, response regulator